MAEQIIVTGATGFIGRHVADRLLHHGKDVVSVGRTCDRERSATPAPRPALGDAQRELGGDWPLSSASTLIHLAGISGRTMCTEKNVAEALSFARRTIRYAQACGTEKAILASSIYATLFENGLQTQYGKHKLEIEEIFHREFRGRLIVLRLPPVYGGQRDKSSVAQLAKMIARGVPLPLARATAKRDYLAMANLLDLIARLVNDDAPFKEAGAAATYEPSDGFAVSTRQLAEYLGKITGQRAKLVPIPALLMRALGRAIGRGEQVSAAFAPLRTEDPGRLLRELGWEPGVRMPNSLEYLAASEAI